MDARPATASFSATLAALAVPPAAWAEAPLNYLRSHGRVADHIAPLTWGLLIVSIAVVVIVTALVLWGLFRPQPADADARVIARPTGGLVFIVVGVGATIAALLASVAWTMVVLASVNRPPSQPALTLDVTGKQWWWKVRYESDKPEEVFDTANEIHIPVGEPVEVKLRSSDVIHSFWIPALGGKTDAIPGQVNTTWIEARTPGTYSGQCTEYCGLEHARMSFRVVAEPRKQFDAWRANQVKPAPPPPDAVVAASQLVFEERCSVCHAVRGTVAGGAYGPDLSHLMTRSTLAAGTVPNTPGYLSAWIADPHYFKPGTRMPPVALSGEQLQQVSSYLETLR